MTWSTAFIALCGVALLILTAIDAARRRRNWFVWTLPVLFVGIPGVIPWLFVRWRTPAAERLSRRRIVELSISVVALIVIQMITAIFVTTFVVQAARAEGRAMSPTINDQDLLVVNKLAYRIGEPHMSEIVMLYYPNDPNKSFVKRVIGEEGDQVRIVDGHVYRNDIPLDDSFVPADYKSHDDWGPQVIPEGYYFVMGDHRNNSSDSRHWGFVPKKYIIGRVQWRWWPIATARSF
jgi:signal peptidase I